MFEYQTISMNLAELVEILVEAGKLPRNKQVKISVSIPGSSYYQSYPKQECINFELFEEKIPIDKFRIKNGSSLKY